MPEKPHKFHIEENMAGIFEVFRDDHMAFGVYPTRSAARSAAKKLNAMAQEEAQR